MRCVWSVLTMVLGLLTLSGAVNAPAGAFIYGDEQVERRITEGKFTRIEVSGVYEISVKRGPDHDVRLSGRENALARATVRIDNDTLYLGHKKGRGFRSKRSVEANITLPDLRTVEISGVVDGRVSGVDTDNFRISVSGVGDLNIDGKCNTLYATLSGVGDLDAADLKCHKATIRVSGVGDARVFADEALDAHVSGIGDLTCYGSPKKVKKNKSFFSSISVR